MNLEPTFDNLVIRRDTMPGESSGQHGAKIRLPDSSKDKASTGTVLAAGKEGRIKYGMLQEQKIQVGDRVLFRAYGTEHTVDNETVFLLNQDEILAVIKS